MVASTIVTPDKRGKISVKDFYRAVKDLETQIQEEWREKSEWLRSATDKALDERDQADKDFWELAKLLHPIRPSDMAKARTEAARTGQPLDEARRRVLRTIRERLERDKFHQMTKAEKFDYLFRKVYADE